MQRTHWPALLVLTLVTLGLAACSSVTVNKVLADPSHYRNREVRVSGNVVDSFSLMERGVYRLRDGTGELWVFSEHGVPRNGARVKVTGTVREGFNIGDLGGRLPRGIGSGLLLVESSHKAR